MEPEKDKQEPTQNSGDVTPNTDDTSSATNTTEQNPQETEPTVEQPTASEQPPTDTPPVAENTEQPSQETEPTVAEPPTVTAPTVNISQPNVPISGSAPPISGTATGTVAGDDPGKTLAIVGIVLAFFAQLIGLILSIVAHNKSKKAGFKNSLATVGIVLNSAFLVIAIIFLFIFGITMFSSLQNLAKANNLVDYIRTNQVDKAVELTDVTEADKEGLKAYFIGLKDSVGTSQIVKSVETNTDLGMTSVIFELQGGTSKYIRVIIKDSKVIEVSVGQNELKSFPDNIKQEISAPQSANTQNTPSPTTSPSTTTTTVCTPYTNTELSSLYNGANPDYDLGGYYDSFFFQPDSTSYQYTIYGDKFTRIATFTKSSVKPYKIELTGSVYGDYNTVAGKALAQQRAEKVKADLVAAGASSASVVIVAPKEYVYGQSSQYDPGIFRAVDLSLEADCSGA